MKSKALSLILFAAVILSAFSLISYADDTYYAITAGDGFIIQRYDDELDDFVQVDKAVEGEEIYVEYEGDLSAVIPEGNHLSYFTVNGEAIEDGYFEMPAKDVVVGISYEKNTPLFEIDLQNGRVEVEYETYEALFSLDCTVLYSEDEGFPQGIDGDVCFDLDKDGKIDLVAWEHVETVTDTGGDDKDPEESDPEESDPEESDPEESDDPGETDDPDEPYTDEISYYYVEAYKDCGVNGSITIAVADTTRTVPFDAVKFTFNSASAVIKGDVNGDGEVDSFDAGTVLKYDAGINDLTEKQIQAADVTGDGEADSFDAAQILKYDAGVISDF